MRKRYDLEGAIVTIIDKDGTKHESKGYGWLDVPASPSKRKPCHCEEIDDVERLFDSICVDCPRLGISVVTITGKVNL